MKTLSIGIVVMSFLGASALHAALEAGPDLETGRILPVACSLDDGRIVVAGGHGAGFVALASLEVGNPATGIFTQVALPNPVDYAAITQLNDGRIFLAGSAYDLGVAPGYTSAMIFDPSDDSVTSVPNMVFPRSNCCAATLADGRVLVVGGWYSQSSAGTPELFDPTDGGSWSTMGQLMQARAWPLVLPTTDGRAVVIGGMAPYGGDYREAVELFDPETSSFSQLMERPIADDAGWYALMPVKDSGEQQLPDGRYVFLGWNSSGASVRYGFLTFDPTTLEFSLREIPTEILEGDAVGSTSIALEGSMVYFLIQSSTGNGAETKVRVGAYDAAEDAGEFAVTEAGTLAYTPYYQASFIVDGRFFGAGGTNTTGSSANFGAVPNTFWMDLPEGGEMRYEGWFYIDYPWMYWFDGDRWIQVYQPIWGWDYTLGDHAEIGP